MTIQVGMSKFECKTKGVARNSRILLSVYDCGNRREEERTILNGNMFSYNNHYYTPINDDGTDYVFYKALTDFALFVRSLLLYITY